MKDQGEVCRLLKSVHPKLFIVTCTLISSNNNIWAYFKNMYQCNRITSTYFILIKCILDTKSVTLESFRCNVPFLMFGNHISKCRVSSKYIQGVEHAT
jgi:hypothetical protein